MWNIASNNDYLRHLISVGLWNVMKGWWVFPNPKIASSKQILFVYNPELPDSVQNIVMKAKHNVKVQSVTHNDVS